MNAVMRFLLLWASLALTGAAKAADIHQLWDQRCGGCHDHAGSFARKFLTVTDGILRGRSDGRDVKVLLATHNGGYSSEDVAAIYSMLLAQTQTPDLFKRKCGDCHATAAQLVREQVVSRDGELYGRYSQRRMADYLPGHGRLSDGENAILLDALARIEREVHRP